MNKQTKRLTAMIATVFLVALVAVISLNVETTPLSQPPLLFVGDFEAGDLTGFYTTTDHGNTPEVVSAGHPIRAGNYSMRAYLHRTESDCAYRTMVTVQADDEGKPELRDEFIFTIGNEYWIGFSIHVQADLVSDPPGKAGIVFQIHGTPDPGEGGRHPPIALRVDTEEEQGELVNYWRIDRLWDPRAFSEGGQQYSVWRQMMLPMDDADIGGWTDWVFHIIFDYNNNDDGLLQVWRNGTQVLDVSGGNCFNDQEGPYPTFGTYKWPWIDSTETNSTWRLFYFDEFRIGDADATYEDVAPRIVPTPTPTTTSPLPTPTSTAISPLPTPTPSTPTATASPTPTATASPTPTTTATPTATPDGQWWENCPPDPTCSTPYPPQPTLTPRPTYTPAPIPTCRPTVTCPPNPPPTPYPTTTPYPISTPYPPQPTPSGT